jgi:HrpA-like RNA helicase
MTVKSYVIIDEVHERSVENDLLLATLRQMLIFASRKRSSAEAKILQVHVREAEGARAQLQGHKAATRVFTLPCRVFDCWSVSKPFVVVDYYFSNVPKSPPSFNAPPST